MFIVRMFHVIKDERKRVFKNSNGFVETYTMFADVNCRFCRIPLESHTQSIAQ